MKKLQIVIVGLLVIGGILLLGTIRGPNEVTTRIVLSGADGLQVTGKYIADGKEVAIDEVLPIEVSISGKRVSVLLESSDDSQSLLAELYINDKQVGAGGFKRNAQIDVKGNTMFSSAQGHFRAF
jgi:hypothetical protein